MMKGELDDFTKQFFKGLGWQAGRNPSGTPFSFYKYKDEKWGDRFIDIASARRIALEVLLREKNREIDVGLDLIGVVGINQAELARQLGELQDDLTKLEKVAEELK